MSTEPHKLAHCAGPFWGDADSFNTFVASAFVKTTLRDFISVLQSTERASASLLSALGELNCRRVSDLTRLTPSLGHAMLASLEPTLYDPLPVGLNLIFEFLHELSPVSFSVDFRQPASLIMTPVVLPPTRGVKLSWNPPNLYLEASGYAASFFVTRECRTVDSFSPETFGPLPTLSRIGPFHVLTRSKNAVFPPLDLDPAIDIGPESLSNFQIAQKLLSDVIPEYANWIIPVVRYVVLTKSPETGFTSGSDRFNPGVVAMSFPTDVLSIAESLVHEAAHQYYFLFDAVAELSDPSHEVLYYSPLRKLNRKLQDILLAFHAAANILCLYQLLIQRSSRWRPDHSSVVRAVSDFNVLADHLVANPALTDAGRTLIEPLYDLISENGWARIESTPELVG